MKRTVFILFILIHIIIAGCGRNTEQAKRYSEMISECDSIIAQANLIIENQNAKELILSKKRDSGLAGNMSQNSITRLDREITNVVQLRSDVEAVKKHLENIKTFAKIGVRVNSRLIYYKRTYVNYSTAIQVHDENVLIQEITEGVSAKQFISGLLAKKPK